MGDDCAEKEGGDVGGGLEDVEGHDGLVLIQVAVEAKDVDDDSWGLILKGILVESYENYFELPLK